jgi:hypothetical protein
MPDTTAPIVRYCCPICLAMSHFVYSQGAPRAVPCLCGPPGGRGRCCEQGRPREEPHCDPSLKALAGTTPCARSAKRGWRCSPSSAWLTRAARRRSTTAGPITCARTRPSESMAVAEEGANVARLARQDPSGQQAVEVALAPPDRRAGIGRYRHPQLRVRPGRTQRRRQCRRSRGMPFRRPGGNQRRLRFLIGAGYHRGSRVGERAETIALGLPMQFVSDLAEPSRTQHDCRLRLRLSATGGRERLGIAGGQLNGRRSLRRPRLPAGDRQRIAEVCTHVPSWGRVGYAPRPTRPWVSSSPPPTPTPTTMPQAGSERL